MKKIYCILFLNILLSGCAFYHQAKPIYPDSGLPHRLESVDSLNPTLKWSPEFEGPYDIAVLEGCEKRSSIILGPEFGNETMYYSAENQSGNSHRVEKQLRPGRAYYWAIRKHTEFGTGEWSTYNYFAFYGIAWVYYRNLWYRFRTPFPDNISDSIQPKVPADAAEPRG